MTRVRKIGVGSQIGAGLSGYVAELSSAILGAELGLPVTHLDHHASYIASWLKILKSDDRAILTAAAKAEQAVKWLRQFDPALGSTLPDELKEAA